jgi:8-oxo-dGTP pyrophosphatase MutT (NUDIX family)
MRSVVERNAVRIVIVDSGGSVLLLHTRDLHDADFNSAWELPGGGREGGESVLEAACREVREETGIELDPGCVSEPVWRRDVLYTYRGQRRLQHEEIAVARIAAVAPVVSTTVTVDFEPEDHFEHRWWAPLDIGRARALFFPRSLPIHLPRVLGGETIAEPLEVWPDR